MKFINISLLILLIIFGCKSNNTLSDFSISDVKEIKIYLHQPSDITKQWILEGSKKDELANQILNATPKPDILKVYCEYGINIILKSGKEIKYKSNENIISRYSSKNFYQFNGEFKVSDVIEIKDDKFK